MGLLKKLKSKKQDKFERGSLKLAYMRKEGEQQKKIAEQLEKLNNLLENGSMGKLSISGSGQSIVSTFDLIENKMETYDNKFENLEDYIQTEIVYNKDYDRCYKENQDLLKFVETYCNHKDKYEVIDLFDKIKYQYEVKRK